MKQTIDLLAFAAHPDDVEIACSGTLIVHKNQGYRTGIIDLTAGELGTRGTAEIRGQESAAASKVLKLDVRENLGLADGFFEYNQENLMRIIETIRKYQPRIVLCTAPSDRHPDHGRASKLVSDACFYAGLPKIETASPAHRPKAVYKFIQDYYIKPDVVMDISDVWEQKLEALLCYSSQFFNPESLEPKTPISGEEFLEFLKGRFADFGRPAGFRFAEGFVSDRYIGVKNFFELS